MRGRIWWIVGAILAGGAVALGAYHAHGLHDWLITQKLAPDQVSHRMEEMATAVRYQMYHALGLLLIATRIAKWPNRWLHVAAALLLLDVLGFSGGLYLIVFEGTPLHWAIVPCGGLVLILGWFVAAVAVALSNSD